LLAFAARQLSPVDLLDACAERITAVDSLVGAFTTLCLERAREEARRSEAAWARGEARPLEGIPFAAKDLFDSEDVATSYGSQMFEDRVATRDAGAVRRVRLAGAVLVGKTRTHEFAWGITCVNDTLGSVHNPWALDRVAGGSSGGSAAALATGEVPLALGSDTGGSIRIPAAFCGVVGLKPTFGRVSASGVWPLSRSLDHPGPMARTPADAGLLLEATAGIDEADPATSDMPLGDLRAELRRGLAGLTVGLCSDLMTVNLASDVGAVFDRATQTLEAGGARLVELEFPEATSLLATFRAIQAAEALQTHRDADLYPARRHEYGPDVLSRLDAATEVTLEQYLRAEAERVRLRAAFARLFRRCDVLLTPVSAGSPVPIGEETVVHEGEQMTFRDLVMGYTAPQNLIGLPSCAVRAGFDAQGVPVGVQFTGRAWDEARVLRAAQGFFDATPEVQLRRPPL
jgi:aspartyl-tRNA(Asn)/glutamyl-tRNA(Gln) amidotransferase subunit A